MATKTKVLVVDSDLDTLSKIYLALLHRNFKVEASNDIEEVHERLKRLKPMIVIIGEKEYLQLKEGIRTNLIVLSNKDSALPPGHSLMVIEKPVQIELLMKMVGELDY